jgi:hypothetical protein
MAQRIDDASKSQYTVDPGLEATKLAQHISKASGFLSTNVNVMTRELRSFVSILEKIRVKAEKKSLFKAVATIFATLTPSISGTIRHQPDPKVRGRALADTALGQAASVIRVGAFLEHIILCKDGSDRLF